MKKNMFKSVTDPDTGLSYHVNSKKGRRILKKYNTILEQDAGMWPFSSSKKKGEKKKSSFFKRNKGKIAAAATAGLGLGLMALKRFSKKGNKKNNKKKSEKNKDGKDTEISKLQEENEKLKKEIKKLSPFQKFTKKISGTVTSLGKKTGFVKENKKIEAKKTNLMEEKENLKKDEQKLDETKQNLEKEISILENKKNECSGMFSSFSSSNNCDIEIEKLENEIEDTKNEIKITQDKILQEKEKIKELDFNVDDFYNEEESKINTKEEQNKKENEEKEKEEKENKKILNIKLKLSEKNGILTNFIKKNQIINEKIKDNKKKLKDLEIKKENLINSFSDYNEMKGGSGNSSVDSSNENFEKIEEKESEPLSSVNSEIRNFFKKLWKDREDTRNVDSDFITNIIKDTKYNLYKEIFPRIKIEFNTTFVDIIYTDEIKNIVNELNSNFKKYNFKFYWIFTKEEEIDNIQHGYLSDSNIKSKIIQSEIGIFKGDYQNEIYMNEVKDFLDLKFSDKNYYQKIKNEIVSFGISQFCKKFLIPEKNSPIKWFFLKSPFYSLTKNEKETILFCFYDYFPFLNDEKFGYVLENQNLKLNEFELKNQINEIYSVYVKLLKKPGWSKFKSKSNEIKKINEGYLEKENDLNKKYLSYDQSDKDNDIYVDFRIFLAKKILFNELDILNINKENRIEKNTILYQLFSKNINIRKSVLNFLSLPAIDYFVISEEAIIFLKEKIAQINNFLKQHHTPYEIFFKNDFDLISEFLKKIEKNANDSSRNKERVFNFGKILNIINNSFFFKSIKSLVSKPNIDKEYLEKINFEVSDLCKLRSDYLEKQKEKINDELDDFSFFKEPPENIRDIIFKNIEIEKRKNNHVKLSCSEDFNSNREHLILYYFECIDSGNNNMFTKIMEYDLISIEIGRIIPYCWNFNINDNIDSLLDDFTKKLKYLKNINQPLKIFGLEFMPLLLMLLDNPLNNQLGIWSTSVFADTTLNLYDIIMGNRSLSGGGEDSYDNAFTALGNWSLNFADSFRSLLMDSSTENNLKGLISEKINLYFQVKDIDGKNTPINFKSFNIFKDKDIENTLLIDKDDGKNIFFDLDKITNLLSYKKGDINVISKKNLKKEFYKNSPEEQEKYNDKYKKLIDLKTNLINEGSNLRTDAFKEKQNEIYKLESEIDNLNTYQNIFKKIDHLKKQIYDIKNPKNESTITYKSSRENSSIIASIGSSSSSSSTKNKPNELQNNIIRLKNRLKNFEINNSVTKYENYFKKNIPSIDLSFNTANLPANQNISEYYKKLESLKKKSFIIPFLDNPWNVYLIFNMSYILKYFLMKHVGYLNKKDKEWLKNNNLTISFEHINNKFTGNLFFDGKILLNFKKNSEQFKGITFLKLKEINFNPYKILKLFLGEHNSIFYSLLSEKWFKNPDKQIGIIEFNGLFECLDDFRWDTNRLKNLFKMIEFKSDLLVKNKQLSLIEKAKSKLIKKIMSDGLFTGLSWFLSGGWWKDNWDMFEIYVGNSMSIFKFHKLYSNLIHDTINSFVNNTILASKTLSSLKDSSEKDRKKFEHNNYVVFKIKDKNGKIQIKKGTLVESNLKYDPPILKPKFLEIVKSIYSGQLRSKIFLKIIYDLALKLNLVPKVNSALIKLDDKIFEPELKYLKNYDKKFKMNLTVKNGDQEIDNFIDVVRVRIDNIIPKLNIIFTDQDQNLLFKNRIELIDNSIKQFEKDLSDDKKNMNNNLEDIGTFVNHELKKNDFLPIDFENKVDNKNLDEIEKLVEMVVDKIKKQTKKIHKIENEIHFQSKIGRLGFF